MGRSDITEIQKMIAQVYQADQAERLAVPYEELNWPTLRANDRARLEQVHDIAVDSALLQRLDGETLYKLAMLFHHSESDTDVRRVPCIAELAGDKGCKRGYWLKATAEDRLLARVGKPQKWGTQFEKVNGEWQKYELAPDEESGVTDELRKKHEVPPRAEQLSTFLASESAS